VAIKRVKGVRVILIRLVVSVFFPAGPKVKPFGSAGFRSFLLSRSSDSNAFDPALTFTRIPAAPARKSPWHAGMADRIPAVPLLQVELKQCKSIDAITMIPVVHACLCIQF
jgi:hypothetical protein